MGLSTPVEEFFLMKLPISQRFLHPHTAWGRRAGQGGSGEWEESEGKKTAAWQKAFPMQGWFSVVTTWVSEPVGRKGQAECTLTSSSELRPHGFVK